MSIIQDRMKSYYPPVVIGIKDIEAIVDAEFPEFETLNDSQMQLIYDKYLVSGEVSEDRIRAWETELELSVPVGATMEDRRDAIVARIRGGTKLNTATISNIVNAFTGGQARAYIQNSTLYVAILSPADNKSYIYENVEREIERLKPAHLGLSVYRAYKTWGQINTNYSTWGDVMADSETWFEVLYNEAI